GTGVSADTANILDVNINNFTISGTAGGSTKALRLLRGTFKLTSQGTSPVLDLSTGGGDFPIPGGTRLWIAGGSAQISGTGDNLNLKGQLKLSAGTFNVGTSTTISSSVFYDSSAAGVEVIGTGVLRVSGALRPATGTVFSYIQSGDSVIVGRYTTVAAGATFQVASNAASVFQMSGGVLALRRAVNNQAIIDIGALAVQRISGGTIHLLDPSLVTANNYLISAAGAVDTVRMYNLTVGPCAGFTGTISLDDIIDVRNNFTMNVASGTFRTANGGGAANRNIIFGGNFTRTAGTFSTGVGTGTTTVVFDGNTGKQTITGTSTFNNVTINNTSSPSDTVMLGASTDLTVAGNWTMTAGKFDAVTNKRLVTFASGTVAQSITGSTVFNNLTLNNTFGNITLASGVLTVDSVLTLTNGVLAIGANSLVLNETDIAAVQGAFGTTRMIQTGGLAGDMGVTKAYPASTHGFRFPVGTGANYTPATIRITNAGTTPAAGTITVVPVNSAHPNLADGSIALPYYWKVTKTGLAADAAAQHYYVYGSGITPLGTEASYIGGYFIPFTWTKPTSSISTTGDSITIFNPDSTIIAADYTAGEDAAYGVPTVFYSRANGNWQTLSTWATGSYGGPTALFLPNGQTPVVIGDSKTVTIPSGLSGRTVLAVTFDQYGGSTPGPGTVLIQNTATNDFGNVSGVGTIILDNTSATPVLPTGTYTTFVAKDSGTVIFAGSVASTIPTGQTTTFNNIVFANNTVKTIGANITVNKSMRILNGQVSMGTFTANHNGGVGDSLFMAAGTVLRVSGAANFPASYSVYNMDPTSKVLYDFNGTTTVSALNGFSYGRLQFLATAATRTRTLAGNINVRDSLHIGDFNNLFTSLSNYNITLGGHLHLVHNTRSLLTLGTSTFTFNGTSPQRITRATAAGGTASFYNLNINNSSGVSFIYSGTPGVFQQLDTVQNVLTINAGNNLSLGRGNRWVFGGNITYPGGTGTITSSDSTDLSMTGTTVNDTLRFASGAVARSFRDFSINRTAAGAQVVVTGTNDSLQLTRTLTLTKGIIRMGTNIMRLLNSAITPISGGDSTSYVDGKMAITFPASTSNVGRNFEVGSGSFYRPVRVTGSTAASRTRVRVEIIPRGVTISSKPADINAISSARFYRISIDSGLVFISTSDTVRISIKTNVGIGGDIEGVSKPDSIRVMRSADSLNWTTLVGAGYQTISPAGRDSGGNANILFTNSSGAGTYYAYGTLSSDNSVPVLLSGKFKAVPYENKVRLAWRTESELDNAYWIIERKEVSTDLSKNQAFQSIMTVEGQGSTSSATDYSEIDYSVELGKTYLYRLADVGFDGSLTYHNDVTVTVELPNKFTLEPNAPNPFNPETTIKFRLPVSAKVSLKVYNILGQEVATLVDRRMDAGFQQAVWNGLNKYNQAVASGIYIYRLTAVSADGKDKFTQTRKMIMLK
ncbi:T9SS type A sorting domain-containing protein, partial [bacterium]|nr:T9SS type A sorting domain-containing protein [bacterium]